MLGKICGRFDAELVFFAIGLDAKAEELLSRTIEEIVPSKDPNDGTPTDAGRHRQGKGEGSSGCAHFFESSTAVARRILTAFSPERFISSSTS